MAISGRSGVAYGEAVVIPTTPPQTRWDKIVPKELAENSARCSQAYALATPSSRYHVEAHRQWCFVANKREC